MKVKIDFQLNRSFGKVERLIFRLVLNGFSNAREIYMSMPVFSDAVIANAIRHLVNQQILSADVKTGTLSLSEPIVAIINMCIGHSYDITIPVLLAEKISNEGLLIAENSDKEVISFKSAILQELLPDIKLDIYVNSLDFIITAHRSEADE